MITHSICTVCKKAPADIEVMSLTGKTKCTSCCIRAYKFVLRAAYFEKQELIAKNEKLTNQVNKLLAIHTK